MRVSVYTVLMMVFLCGVSYAQDQQKPQLTTQNEALDKAEAAIREKFGPAILSITRDFREPCLVVEVDEIAMWKIADSEIPEIKAAAVPEYKPKPDSDITHQPPPERARTTAERLRDTATRAYESLPVKPGYKTTDTGGRVFTGTWRF
jgi:hypothetical protein